MKKTKNKKAKTIATFLALIVAASAICIGVMHFEKNKQTPQERYMEAIQTSVTNTINSNDAESTPEAEAPQTIVMNDHYTVQYEFLGYEIIDDVDLLNHTEFLPEYFFNDEVADPNYIREYTDYLAMQEDYPLVAEYIDTFGQSGMTAAEYEAFLDEHLDEYTTYRHPETKYFFFHCIITNVSDEPVDEYINMVRLLATRDGEPTGASDINCYFDMPQNTEGEDRWHRYFVYTLQPGESIDCIIASRIWEDYCDYSAENTYYIGFPPVGLDEWIDPSTFRNMIPFTNIPEGI